MTIPKDAELGHGTDVTKSVLHQDKKALAESYGSTATTAATMAADVQNTCNVHSEDHNNLRKQKIILWKDCVVLSVAWLCLYMGYNSISAVQSSLNSDQGLGVTTMCVEFATMTLGNLFTDSSIIKRLGCKWTIALGMGIYSVYMSMNFYPSWYTLVPLAAISGFSSAAMWVAQSAYLARLGMTYGLRFGFDPDKYKGRFLGFLYMAYLSSNVLGNMVSSLILGSNMPDGNTSPTETPYLDICDASYCNEDLTLVYGGFHNGVRNSTKSTSRVPGREQVYYFCAFCVGCGILATIIVTFLLDTLSKLDIEEGIGDEMSTKQLLLSSVRQWKDIKQVFLIPIGLYNGMDNPFWTAEFTKAYITCPIGMHFIGYVMMVYGLTSATVAVVFGWFSNRRYRLLPFVFAFTIHFSAAIALISFRTDPNNATILFVLSAIWGSGSGVWSSQVPIFYSMVFPDNLEAAFSNSRIWDAIGRTVSYGWSYPLCTIYKIYLIMSFISVGLLGLVAIEVREWYLRRMEPKRNSGETTGVATASSQR